jgi:hypothetical protein
MNPCRHSTCVPEHFVTIELTLREKPTLLETRHSEFGHEWFEEATRMNQSNKALSYTVLLRWGWLFLLILSQPIAAQADTYYVEITGNDSNPGTSDRPWRHPQKCVDRNSPLVKGDTCLIGKGTYTDTDGDGIVIYIRSSAPQGTASEPITLKSASPLGAVISLSSTGKGNSGIYVGRSHYVIEGFDIQGGKNPLAATAGINVSGVVTGLTIRQNAIHGQGVGVCSESSNAYSGIQLSSSSNVTIEHNRIYHIGRLRNGVQDCTTTKNFQDHGVYSPGASNVTIRRNIFYDITRGYALHVYSGRGKSHENVFIYNNTISGKSPTGRPSGQIALCNTLRNVHIKNNIFHDLPLDYVIQYCAAGTNAISLVISHNLTNGTRNDFQNPNKKPFSGVTQLSNRTNVDPRFVDAESRNFKLLSTSPAINSGTNMGLPYKGSAPDIGAYEFSEQDDPEPLRPEDVRIQ